MTNHRTRIVALVAGCCALAVAVTALPAPQAKPKPAKPSAAPSRQTAKSVLSDQHWVFQPLHRPPLPTLLSSPLRKGGQRGVIKNPLDAFILAALEKKGLTLTAPADRRTLMRRVTFDLIGLPPTPQEVEQFVNDPAPHAYEKLVDRLLASPHYGERWGRQWLDVARYADSDGQESDHNRPTAYHYRDFVIRALNEDMPYNTFVRWQLAGDEYEPDNPRAIAATGFLTAGTHANLDSVPMEEEKIRERYNELDDILSTTGQAFLGMTMGCARCHDHKYDPISIRDYYRMAAIFNAGDRAEVPLLPWTEAKKRREVEQAWKAQVEAAKKAGDAAAVKALEAQKPAPVPSALAMADFGAKPRESWLLERGDFHIRKEKVTLGFLSVLTHNKPASAYWASAKAKGVRDDTTYQRRALADWMTDTEQGAGALLARVIVNRLWLGHFGEGLVRTVNDFGRRSDGPTHPALLEWLASELVRGGWRLKPLHRTIVLSAAYRQGTTYNPQSAKVDPENRLLWRRRPRRIESESFRDAMLAVAGTLNSEMYGPAFKPPIQPEAMLARNVQNPYPMDAKDAPETRRRTVYMFHKRVVPYPLLQVFDAPDASTSCGRRNITTVPTQALALLNDPFLRLRATEFATRIQTEGGSDPAAQVQFAYRLALGRMPSAKELNASVRFIERQSAARRQREKGEEAKRLALTDFAQVIFGLNEFIYVD